MNEYTYFVDEIKNRVNAKEAARFYGLTFNRSGFANCPFHSEKTPSFSINTKKQTLHCFGCGWGGDVIEFTKKMFGLDFIGAICKLNTDFNLCLPIDRKPTLSEQRDAEQRQREIVAKREAEQHSKAYDLEQYNRLLCFKSWLCVQEQTEAVTSDLQYVQRLLEQSVIFPIAYDVTTRVEALLSKHDNADTFKWFWKEENQAFPTYEQFYGALYNGLML